MKIPGNGWFQLPSLFVIQIQTAIQRALPLFPFIFLGICLKI